MARRDKELLIFLSKHLIFISRFLIPNLFADIVYFISPIYTSYYADRFSRKNFDLQNAFFYGPPLVCKKSMTIGKLGKLELISTVNGLVFLCSPVQQTDFQDQFTLWGPLLHLQSQSPTLSGPQKTPSVSENDFCSSETFSQSVSEA